MTKISFYEGEAENGQLIEVTDLDFVPQIGSAIRFNFFHHRTENYRITDIKYDFIRTNRADEDTQLTEIIISLDKLDD